MKNWHSIPGLLILTLALATISCNKEGKSPDQPNGLDRKPMLENYANNYIVPAYANMLAELAKLKTTIQEFNSTTDEAHMAVAKQQLYSTYLAWQSTDLYEFGPAENASLRSFMNTYPATVSKVNNNIATGGYDLEAFGNKDAQGLPALDYLLNGQSIDKYTTDAQATARKQYLLDIVNKLLEKLTKVNDDWATYKSSFISNTGTDANSSLSQMVNGYVAYYERYLRGGKIGLPVGAMTGTALPGHVEGYYAPESSKKLAVAALNSVLNFYAAKTVQGASMKSYLAAIGTKDDKGTLMADLIEQELNQCVDGLNALDGTLYDNISTNRTAVLKVYDEIQDVVPLLKVDMVSAFSISITYTDNDGD